MRDLSHDSGELPKPARPAPRDAELTKMTRAELAAWLESLDWTEWMAARALLDQWRKVNL